MGIFDKIFPLVDKNIDSPDYKTLLAYLTKQDIDAAISFKIDSHFSDERIAKSPGLRKAAKKLMLDLFNPAEQRLDSLVLEKAIRLKQHFFGEEDDVFFKDERFVFSLKMFVLRNLKNGSFESLKSAVEAKNEFALKQFDGMSDPVFQEAVIRGLHFNMLNDDRLYENNIEKIRSNFLSGQEHLLRKAASLAVEKLRNPSSLSEEGLINPENFQEIERRLEEIQSKYLKSENQFNRQVA